MHLSYSLMLNPFDIIIVSNISCHCFGVCMSPYNDFTVRQTLCSWSWNMNPSGCFMYISSYKSPFKKRVLTSVWWISKSLNAAIAINILIEVILIRGEQVSKKSRPSFFLCFFAPQVWPCTYQSTHQVSIWFSSAIYTLMLWTLEVTLLTHRYGYAL